MVKPRPQSHRSVSGRPKKAPSEDLRSPFSGHHALLKGGAQREEMPGNPKQILQPTLAPGNKALYICWESSQVWRGGARARLGSFSSPGKSHMVGSLPFASPSRGLLIPFSRRHTGCLAPGGKHTPEFRRPRGSGLGAPPPSGLAGLLPGEGGGGEQGLSARRG